MSVFWDVTPCGMTEIYHNLIGTYYYLHLRAIQVTLLCVTLAAAVFSVTLVNIYQTARRHISEDSHLHNHSHENLKFHIPNRNLIPAELTYSVHKVRV